MKNKKQHGIPVSNHVNRYTKDRKTRHFNWTG